MPTDALESILYRDLSKAAARDLIDVASPLLRELVNHATNALARCAASGSHKVDEDVPALALYRHIAEMTDGVEVLIAQSCPAPAIPLVRSSFEALLSLQYIIEDDSLYTSRALAWLVGYTQQRLAMYDRLDSTTSQGKQSRAVIESDEVFSRIALPPLAEVQRAQDNLHVFLTKPHIKPIAQEYERLRTKHRKRPNWHHMYGGPPTLWALAKHLRRGAQYELLYRYWSRTVHAQDFLRFIDRTEDGKQAVARLRDPAQIGEVSSYAATFMLEATRRILSKFRPGENLAPWYRREVQCRYHTICRGEPTSETAAG